MTYELEVLDNGTTRILVDFTDEEVNLTGETTVKGGQEEAEGYLPIFERDLRANYSHLFPQPEPEEHPEEGELEDEIH